MLPTDLATFHPLPSTQSNVARHLVSTSARDRVLETTALGSFAKLMVWKRTNKKRAACNPVLGGWNSCVVKGVIKYIKQIEDTTRRTSSTNHLLGRCLPFRVRKIVCAGFLYGMQSRLLHLIAPLLHTD